MSVNNEIMNENKCDLPIVVNRTNFYVVRCHCCWVTGPNSSKTRVLTHAVSTFPIWKQEGDVNVFPSMGHNNYRVQNTGHTGNPYPIFREINDETRKKIASKSNNSANQIKCDLFDNTTMLIKTKHRAFDKKMPVSQRRKLSVKTEKGTYHDCFLYEIILTKKIAFSMVKKCTYKKRNKK